MRARSSTLKSHNRGRIDAVQPRDDLPAGVVTLVFTDIEGSTRLLHDLGDRYVQVP